MSELDDMLGIDPEPKRKRDDEMCPCGLLPALACDGKCVEILLPRIPPEKRKE